MDDKKLIIHKRTTEITKVVISKIENGVQKSHVLSDEELEQWKVEHGFIKEESKNDNTDDKS